ncbi:hypothetical protein BRADI_5g08515v3 [Brachypodium distachyon]|uniref:Uncharacterized protein n=1 Tax=Brachypodium distachyon TaxID=15368 RepID=A0A2K2CFY9_BRADI|nr:hypothetical protein BRADI_5g08515v3 [Brachypodium distachyon]
MDFRLSRTSIRIARRSPAGIRIFCARALLNIESSAITVCFIFMASRDDPFLRKHDLSRGRECTILDIWVLSFLKISWFIINNPTPTLQNMISSIIIRRRAMNTDSRNIRIKSAKIDARFRGREVLKSASPACQS